MRGDILDEIKTGNRVAIINDISMFKSKGNIGTIIESGMKDIFRVLLDDEIDLGNKAIKDIYVTREDIVLLSSISLNDRYLEYIETQNVSTEEKLAIKKFIEYVRQQGKQ